jgi:hypothetical protein
MEGSWGSSLTSSFTLAVLVGIPLAVRQEEGYDIR